MLYDNGKDNYMGFFNFFYETWFNLWLKIILSFFFWQLEYLSSMSLNTSQDCVSLGTEENCDFATLCKAILMKNKCNIIVIHL